MLGYVPWCSGPIIASVIVFYSNCYSCKHLYHMYETLNWTCCVLLSRRSNWMIYLSQRYCISLQLIKEWQLLVFLRCVKARVQNLMKNGIQNLICMHFNLLFCKNHHEILTVNVNHHCQSYGWKIFRIFSLRMRKFTKNINCQFRTRFLSFTKIIFIGCWK